MMTQTPVKTPPSGVATADAEFTAVRENDPVMGYERKNDPITDAYPIARISCVGSNSYLHWTWECAKGSAVSCQSFERDSKTPDMAHSHTHTHTHTHTRTHTHAYPFFCANDFPIAIDSR
jgi:hypothetical protein